MSVIIEEDVNQSDITIKPDKIPEKPFFEMMALFRSLPWLIDKDRSLLELWNFCESEDQRKLLEELLHNFFVMDESLLKEETIKLINFFKSEWKVDPSNTIIVAIADGDSDGSQMLLYKMKSNFINIDNWDEDNFVSSIGKGLSLVNNHKYNKVILIDDFVGTGKKAKRKIKWFIDRLKEDVKDCVLVYFSSLVAMDGSEVLLKECGVEFHVNHKLKRGISDYYKGEELNNNTALMESLESKLSEEWKGKSLNDYRFGFKKSESLFAINNSNIPNNVFPVFWWGLERKNERRRTLFNRLRP